jgi:hypothetical protein
MDEWISILMHSFIQVFNDCMHLLVLPWAVCNHSPLLHSIQIAYPIASPSQPAPDPIPTASLSATHNVLSS